MSKEIQIQVAQKIQEHYECKVIINDVEPYCLICVSDIGRILGLTNINKNAKSNVEVINNTIKIKTQTKGGEQTLSFMTYSGLHSLLAKSRKPSVIDFCKKVNIDICSRIYACIEADTLKCIMESFSNEEIMCQYHIKSYMVDLYFPKYKLIVECDENFHKYNTHHDLIRENKIKEEDDYTFIRYSPYAEDFNIFKVINMIIKVLYKRA
jgi:very-short-patch-repair endonuclease